MPGPSGREKGEEEMKGRGRDERPVRARLEEEMKLHPGCCYSARPAHLTLSISLYHYVSISLGAGTALALDGFEMDCATVHPVHRYISAFYHTKTQTALTITKYISLSRSLSPPSLLTHTLPPTRV